MKKAYIILVAFIIIILIGVLGYLAYRDGHRQNGQVQPDQTANWNTVRNNELGFSLKYPDNFFDVGHEPKIIDTRTNSFGRELPNNTEEIVINNAIYYYSHKEDAAAGHHYFYDYYTPKQNTFFYIELDTSETNCDNYLPLEQGNTDQEKNYNACIAQRENRPKVLKQITGTFTFDEAK